MKVIGITPVQVPMVWPNVAPLLEKAIDRGDGTMTLDGLRSMCETRDGQLWVILGDTQESCAAAVTAIQNSDALRYLLILALGGMDMYAWIHALDETLSRFAKAHGCSQVRLIGRPGWARVLESIGAKQVSVVLAKEV